MLKHTVLTDGVKIGDKTLVEHASGVIEALTENTGKALNSAKNAVGGFLTEVGSGISAAFA